MWKVLGAFIVGAFFGIPLLQWIYSEAQKHAVSALHSVTSQALQQNATNFLTSHVASYIAQVVK